MEIRPADLVLVRGTGLIAETIKRVTHSPYSHVAMVVKPNELIEAQGFRDTGYQALDFYRGCSGIFTLDSLTDEQRAGIVEYVTKEVGSKYDYQLLGWELGHYILHIDLPFHEDGRHDCMTLCSDGYRANGADPWPGKSFPVPGDGSLPPMRYLGSY